MLRGQKTSAEQVVLKLRQIEVQTAQGKSIAVACKEASPQALYAEQRFSGHNVNIGVRQRREGTGRGFRG
jgi:putative transposase